MIAKYWSILFFVRGGIVNPDQAAKFRVAGQNGSYWSSRADSNTDLAYEFYFNTSVDPSGGTYRDLGFSLRCLIPTS